MGAVRMVQMAFHEIVDMIAMGHRLVSATCSMDVSRLVAGTAVVRRADVRIGLRDLDRMLVDVVAMRVVQVPLVKIVDMVAMPQSDMAAPRTMRVCMAVMVSLRTSVHFQSPFIWVLRRRKHRISESMTLGRVLDSAFDQAQHVIVRQGIEDMLGFPTPGHETNREQRLQSGRNGTQLLALQLGKLRHAQLSATEPNEDTQALGIAQCAQHGGRSVQVIAPW